MASFTLHGIPVSRGIAIGRAHLLRPAARDVKHYLVAEERLEAEVKFLLEQIEKLKQTPMITEQSEIKRMAARH